MQTLPIDQIQLPPDRQRSTTSLPKLLELKESIRTEGLFHALILTSGNRLVAGATRFAAIQSLHKEGLGFWYNGAEVPLGEVPFTYTHKTDEASIFRIELEENLRREALSPLDEAKALAALHKLQVDGAKELIPGTGIKERVTFQDTAKVLGEITGQPKTSDPQRISESIIVDRFKDVPAVKSA